MQKYHVKLSKDEMITIEQFLQSNKCNVQSKARANVLLDLNETNGSRPFSVEDIVLRNGVSKVTIWHVCKKYQYGGVNAVLYRQNNTETEQSFAQTI